MFRQTPGFRGRTFITSWLSTEGDLDFCVRSTHRGTSIRRCVTNCFPGPLTNPRLFSAPLQPFCNPCLLCGEGGGGPVLRTERSGRFAKSARREERKGNPSRLASHDASTTVGRCHPPPPPTPPDAFPPTGPPPPLAGACPKLLSLLSLPLSSPSELSCSGSTAVSGATWP